VLFFNDTFMDIPCKLVVDGFECNIQPFIDFQNKNGFKQIGLNVLDDEMIPFLRMTETIPDTEEIQNREVVFRPVKDIPEMIPLLVSAGIIEPDVYGNYGSQFHRLSSYLLSPRFYLESLRLLDPPS